MSTILCMERTSSADIAKWIDTLSGSVIPAKPRAALRSFILERDIGGRAFSMVLNGHALGDFNLPDVSQAMATKIRKCWHADFPESVSIKATVSAAAEDHQRHDPRQDGVDYCGYEGYAGFKPGPGAGRNAVDNSAKLSRSWAGSREADAVSSRQAVSATMKSPKRTLPQVTFSLDVMRAALDSVAERADLNRQEMYLGLRDVIPDEVWDPLWASYTVDLARELHNEGQHLMDMQRSEKRRKSSPMLVKKPTDSASTHQDYVPQQLETTFKSAQSADPQNPQDDLANLPELRTRLERKHTPHGQALDQTLLPGAMTNTMDRIVECDEELQSNAETLRSEAQTMASDAMSHWLGKDSVSRATLSPFEIATWLRMLPKDRLKEDTLKTIAKQVIDKHMDEEEFRAAIAAGLDSFGISDQRQAAVLQRYFKQKQNEAAMAEAAKQEGALIRKFNAKLEAKVWQA
jgi:hypothetical protein